MIAITMIIAMAVMKEMVTITITTATTTTTTTTTKTTIITRRLPDPVLISVLLCVFSPTQHGRARAVNGQPAPRLRVGRFPWLEAEAEAVRAEGWKWVETRASFDYNEWSGYIRRHEESVPLSVEDRESSTP